MTDLGLFLSGINWYLKEWVWDVQGAGFFVFVHARLDDLTCLAYTRLASSVQTTYLGTDSKWEA